MARKKPSNIKASGIPEYIAHTDARGKQTQLEARLGRLLANLPPGHCIGHTFGGRWTVAEWSTSKEWEADTIEAVLFAAGITDE